MKSPFIKILIWFVAPLNLAAQQVSLVKDTAFVDGKPYCIVKKAGGLTSEYTLYDLENNEFMFVKYSRKDEQTSYSYYEITFLPSGNKSEIKNDWNLGSKLAKEAYKNKMVVDGKFNPAGEDRYLKIYGPPKKDSNEAGSPYSGNEIKLRNYKIVDRNKNGLILVIGSEITQANVLIGKVKTQQKLINANNVYIIDYYLPDGTRIAEARIEGFNNKTVTIQTFKDEQGHSFTIEFLHNKEKEIAEYLVRKNYL